MAHHSAEIVWERGAQRFVDQKYSRAHRWRFDGGAEIAASSSPGVVPMPMSDASAVDPEEAFVASLSSCHLLWFLSLAAQEGLVVDRYQDQALGVMERNDAGKLAMTKVTLRPRVDFSGERKPSPAQIETLHERAHAECFIANSVRTTVTCEPVFS